MSHPTDFLLPDGWVEMYMLQMPQLFHQRERTPSAILRLEYRQGLLALIRSFCNLINRIEPDQQFYHKLSGKRRPRELLVRRNVDFLTVCVLNAFSWQDNNLIFEYSQTLSIVKKVSGEPPVRCSCAVKANMYRCRRHLVVPSQMPPS